MIGRELGDSADFGHVLQPRVTGMLFPDRFHLIAKGLGLAGLPLDPSQSGNAEEALANERMLRAKRSLAKLERVLELRPSLA